MTADPAVPPGLLASLDACTDASVLLIRHSDRFSIPPGSSDRATRLTAQGEARARALGRRLALPPAWALASPYLRCVRTAELVGVTPAPSDLLGAPGAFVIDSVRGAQVFGERGTPAVVRGQLRGQTWGCMRPMAEGAALIHRLLQSHARERSGFGVAVSHDAIVIPYIGWATGHDFETEWLDPLDGVVISSNHVVWRGRRYEVPL